MYLLHNEYHHTFLNFWQKNLNSETIEVPENLKKGILHSEVIGVGEFIMPYNVAENYQAKVCVHGSPLWWHLDTNTLILKLIPQD